MRAQHVTRSHNISYIVSHLRVVRKTGGVNFVNAHARTYAHLRTYRVSLT